ncbi:MAG: pilin [Tahibacter sp.]
MSHDWFYADRHNQQQGPVADTWLASAYGRGEVDAGTLVWREGLAAWVPLSRVVAEIGIPFAAAPPPLRPPGSVRSVPAKPSSSNTWVIVTVAVLFVFLFVGGILAAIAIPAYQDFTQRAKVSEGLMMASRLKPDVAEFVQQESRCPTNGESTFKSATDYATTTVASITIGAADADGCTIQVRFKDFGSRAIAGKEVTWTLDPKGNWRANSSVPEKYLPMSLRGNSAR